MIVLGLDPGVTLHGWALLDMPPVGRGRMLAGGHMPTDEIPARFQCVREWYVCAPGYAPWIEVVGIETPAGYVHEHKRGAALLATAVEAGKLIERAGLMGRALSAAQVRKSLVRDPTASDEAVEAALVAWQRWMVDHGREMRVGL